MNTTVMAERQAKAIQAIQDATARLGGQLTIPAVRAPNPATKQVLILEAIAAALAGIELPAAPEAPPETAPPQEPEAPAPKPRRKGKEL
jgi:hypothetical protein